MGVYGHPGVEITEGYLPADPAESSGQVCFPLQPESYYHLSEAASSNALMFTCRNWSQRITELRSGIVYGLYPHTWESHPSMLSSFHYDAVFGCCPNRFAVQAAIGHPLTVFGEGNQKYALLPLDDLIKGLDLIIENPPDQGQINIVNLFSEIMSIKEIAATIQKCAQSSG